MSLLRKMRIGSLALFEYREIVRAKVNNLTIGCTRRFVRAQKQQRTIHWRHRARFFSPSPCIPKLHGARSDRCAILDHAALRFFIARTSSVPCARQRSPKVVKAVSLYGNAAVKRKKRIAWIITRNNSLHVDPPYSSPFRWLRETAFGYERMITHDGANPTGAFRSPDGIIYTLLEEKERVSYAGRVTGSRVFYWLVKCIIGGLN